MGLRLHLTHRSGESVTDIGEDRPVSRPIVVGSDPTADVPLPPTVPGIAPRHCFLFLHEGQWFAQDARTASGTFRNGEPVLGPMPVEDGDALTLGPQVDAPAVTVFILPATPRMPPTADLRAQASAVAGAVTSRASRPYYVPARRSASPAAITVTVLLILAILLGGGLWLRAAYQKRELALSQPTVVIVPAADPPVATRPATTQAIRIVRPPPPPPGATAEPPPPPPSDPRKLDPEWLAVESAKFEEPVLAIVKFNDYLQRFPESPLRAEVERYVDEAMDRIWWQRLIELFEERDTSAKQVDERKAQLASSQDPAFKKNLETEMATWTERRDQAEETIRKTMNYKPLGPPNPYDSAALTGLRAARDAGYYSTWKAEVLRSIKRSRGQRLPWKATR